MFTRMFVFIKALIQQSNTNQDASLIAIVAAWSYEHYYSYMWSVGFVSCACDGILQMTVVSHLVYEDQKSM